MNAADLLIYHQMIKIVNKIDKRMRSNLKAEEEHNAFLCRSADEVWADPNANEKSEHYLKLISESDSKLAKQRQIIEDLQTVRKGIELMIEENNVNPQK